jgi:hypothetical protein
MQVLSSEIKVSSSQISVFSSDYDVSSSQGDVGSSNDGADSSVDDVYMHGYVNSLPPSTSENLKALTVKSVNFLNC